MREAEEGGYATEAGVARRCLGSTCLSEGDLLEARTHLERALGDYRPERDARARFRLAKTSGSPRLTISRMRLGTWCGGPMQNETALLQSETLLLLSDRRPSVHRSRREFASSVRAEKYQNFTTVGIASNDLAPEWAIGPEA